MTHATGGAINRVSRTTEVDMYTIDRIGFTILCINAMAYLSNDFKGSVNSMEERRKKCDKKCFKTVKNTHYQIFTIHHHKYRFNQNNVIILGDGAQVGWLAPLLETSIKY